MITSDVAKGRCPVCWAPSCGCGPSTSHIDPVDMPERQEAAMAELKEYEVKQGKTTLTMMLSEAEAKRLNAKPVGDKPTPRSKKRSAPNKGSGPDA